MSLLIEKQESLASDKFAKNGKNKVLHIVAKNIPFVLHVASSVSLNQHPLHAKLYYDWDSELDVKEVDTLKSSPIEYTSHVNSTALKSVVELRLGVLSSQHEQAYFRIKLSTSVAETWSQPIKVISKRNQVRKMLAKNEIAPCNVNMSALPVPKRTATDSIAETLVRLEQQQQEQALLLRQLVSSSSKNSNDSSSNFQPITTQYVIPDPSEADFTTAFAAFLRSFKSIPVEDRPSKIRKAIFTLNDNDAQELGEFVGCYHTEMALASMDSVSFTSQNSSPVVEEGDDNNTFDGFYGEFLSSASSSPLYSPTSSPTSVDQQDGQCGSWFSPEIAFSPELEFDQIAQ
jgi:hypothetical protein